MGGKFVGEFVRQREMSHLKIHVQAFVINHRTQIVAFVFPMNDGSIESNCI